MRAAILHSGQSAELMAPVSRHRDADILSADEVRDRDVQGAEAIETINNLSSSIGNEGRKIKVVGCG